MSALHTVAPAPELTSPALESPELASAELASPAPRELARLAQSLASRGDLWRPLLHVDPNRRWYARLATGEDWEAWLLTWAPGQSTGLHDHGDSAGAFVVLSGEVIERVPAPRRRGGLITRTLRSHDVRAFADGYVHDVTGSGDGPAASLHVYGPRLARMNRYELDEHARLRLVAIERAGESW